MAILSPLPLWLSISNCNILPVPEHAVEYEASHCAGDACSIQDGEDDSEGKMY